MTQDSSDPHGRASQASFPFVQTIVRPETVDSTNALARSLLLQGLDDLPLLVWADMQIVGKGQRGNPWWSDTGSLTFTIAIDPAAHGLIRDQEPRLSLVTAVAVIKAIEALGWSHSKIGIRWPNDIETGDRKLGGILPELVDTSLGHRLIVGVGLNVLTRIDQAPPEVKRMATSLSALQATPLTPNSLPQLLSGILHQFGQELKTLSEDSPEQAREWDSLNLLRNQVVRVNLGSRIVIGRVQAIDAQGALCLTEDHGTQTHRLYGGQILREVTTLPTPKANRDR